ncbi:unnamed protein product [Thlaspi arvense]|uniref:Uncharacterized protein n=1 Tax=Thlaspi arvense TaxID=13288 RepID=A0AAU9SM95_THLAR|nr:unnamed protein product [Thlaspi arvense]
MMATKIAYGEIVITVVIIQTPRRCAARDLIETVHGGSGKDGSCVETMGTCVEAHVSSSLGHAKEGYYQFQRYAGCFESGRYIDDQDYKQSPWTPRELRNRPLLKLDAEYLDPITHRFKADQTSHT